MEQQEFDKLIIANGSKNLGWLTKRLKYDPSDKENALSSHWQQENIKKRWINFGQGLLQDLFCYAPNDQLRGSFRFLKITHRDRLVAATVIQWLGTTIGFCFLQEALKKAGYKIVKIKE